MAQADIIIRNARIIDGTGGVSYTADVAICDDRVADISATIASTANVEIDANGLVLAPGFIDSHTHDDRVLLSDPEFMAKASQGVTTVVTGNCGISLAPLVTDHPPPPLDLLGDGEWYRFAKFADYLGELERAPGALNVLPLCGHTALRAATMHDLDHPADKSERRAMAHLLDEALDAGAIGLSTGLAYRPALATGDDELLELQTIVGRARGIYATHMRSEEEHVVACIHASADGSAKAGVPVVISHLKVSGPQNYGRSTEALAAIDDGARKATLAFDVYPYAASSTVLEKTFLERGTPTLITWSVPHPDLAGRMLDDIMAEQGWDTDRALAELTPAGAIYFSMEEADVRNILAHPRAMIGSDGLPHDAHPHPRLWGTFPRVLGYYCREERLFELEEAVHRMTGLTAAAYGLTDRGIVRQGAFADLVLFDPETVIDRATFADPCQPAEGIVATFVNGRRIWDKQATTGARPGRTIRRDTLNIPTAMN